MKAINAEIEMKLQLMKSQCVRRICVFTFGNRWLCSVIKCPHQQDESSFRKGISDRNVLGAPGFAFVMFWSIGINPLWHSSMMFLTAPVHGVQLPLLCVSVFVSTETGSLSSSVLCSESGHHGRRASGQGQHHIVTSQRFDFQNPMNVLTWCCMHVLRTSTMALHGENKCFYSLHQSHPT